jgi:DNA-binding transcriptional MerR regulator
MQTPAQVAKLANVTAQTIRNYTDTYGELLSTAARREDGSRLYTDEDVRILCDIASLRKSRVPPGEIIERIRNNEVPPIIDVTPNVPSNAPQEPSKDAPDAPLALQLVVPSLQRQMDMMERQIETLARRVEAKDRGAVWWARLEGAALALIAGAFLLFLLWLSVNGV